MANGSSATYEIGLVMAGAISAGAYSAGVMDFLIEALDAWQAAKDAGQPVPPHDVRLKVMTGASAGAMTAAIAAIALQGQVDPVHDVDHPPPARRNRFYDAWVRRIDIAHLLGDSDLRAENRLVSVLDASVLQSIATEALSVDLLPQPRRYVDDPLPVYLTVANLRGVPYGFGLRDAGGGAVYGMVHHGDHMRFSVSRSGASVPASRLLDPVEAPRDGWPSLAEAALASGAFPVGLRARILNRPYSDLASPPLRWPPQLPNVAADAAYEFTCVDGGLIDNEPFELARRELAGDGRNPRPGLESRRAVVMVDPFPNRVVFDPDYRPDDRLMHVVGAMFSALVDQARFKTEELELADADNVYSRFMIAPTRRDASGREAALAIASGTLGGFGGFLSERFRKHDYVLGRRNCQNFLRRHFCLPRDNPLFAGWPDEASRQPWYVRDASGEPIRFTETDDQPMLPIVPLVDQVRGEIESQPWPRPADVDVERLRDRIEARLKLVAGALIDGEFARIIGGSMARWVARQAVNRKVVPKLRDLVVERITDELKRLN